MKNYFSIFVFLFISITTYGSSISKMKKEIEEYFYQHQFQKAIIKCDQLINICKKEENKKELALAYENLGIFYAELNDFKTSFKYFYKALYLTNKKENPKTYYSIIQNIGTSFYDAENYQEAIRILKKSIQYFDTTKYYPNTVANYTNIAISYQGLKRIKEALKWNKKAQDIAQKNHIIDQYTAPLINMGDIYFDLHQLDSAMLYYQDALFYFQKSSDTKGIWHTKIGIANVLAQKGKLKEANSIFSKGVAYFKSQNDYKYLIICYKSLSSIAEKEQKFKNAINFKNQQIKWQTLLFEKEKLEEISNHQTKAALLKSRQKLENKTFMLSKEIQFKNLLIITIVILLIGIFLIYYQYKKRIEANQNHLELREQIALKEKNELQQNLSDKDKELETFALTIVQRNETLEQLLGDLKILKKQDSESILNQINSLILKTKQKIKKNKVLEQFSDRVEEVNQKFYSILKQKYPELTDKEMKLCALIKLNLSSKDIANLTDVTLGAVTMARYRLRTKLDIDKDENLVSFLQKLS